MIARYGLELPRDRPKTRGAVWCRHCFTFNDLHAAGDNEFICRDCLVEPKVWPPSMLRVIDPHGRYAKST